MNVMEDTIEWLLARARYRATRYQPGVDGRGFVALLCSTCSGRQQVNGETCLNCGGHGFLWSP